ncbi:MAG TPA: histidine--tRNA ligase [Flavisolibacter sp.]|nr:histidine--tRNA ligase [Flavisolibacter sp.]
MSKPSIPQGTRDFGPDVVRKRAFIFNTIRSVFELYGFLPIETPAMENLETLMGKYGEEGDKLIFKILNNGLDNPNKEHQIREDFEKILKGKNNKGITERALKYDLTIPFARYVAMNHGQLTFPFKRYQVQPVWRADRPQKGRYREFYQCDADVVGSNSLLNEVEFVNLYTDVFSKLGIEGCELRINSRKILSALAEVCGGAGKLTDITIAIDKLDKIGLEKVKEELYERGLSQEQITIIEKYLGIDGTNEAKLASIKEIIQDTEDGKKGINELEFILNMINEQRAKDENVRTGITTSLIIDFTLARGLNYYTGIIFEAKAPASVKIGSIGGGGRYDDLTGLFGVPNIPGAGISFGVDRIYDVMEELQLFPSKVEQGTRVLFFNTGLEESKKAYELLANLRKSGIAAELFHEQAKFDKQFKYAEKKQIPFIIIIGSKELEEKAFMIKDLRSGEQRSVPFADISMLSFN